MEQFKSLFNNGALFEQFEVRRWLERRNQGTKETYISALKTFTEFTKLTPKQLIDMAEGDRKKSIREQGEPELKVKSFYEYLITDYPLNGKGRSKKRKTQKKGASKNMASAFANAVKGFYSANGSKLEVEIQKSSSKERKC
jgi:hypothetical protein